MKKLIATAGFLLIILFITGTVNAQSAQSPEKEVKAQTAQSGQTTPGNFVDKNGDGICDNHQGKNLKAKNCQGTCTGFTDANGDGVCDNCKGQANCGQGNCCGKAMQKGNCQGMGQGNCCGKDAGHQHRHGQKACQRTTAPEK